MDPEKLPTTLITEIRVVYKSPHGAAVITSRYQKFDEFQTMLQALLDMPEELSRDVRSVWCDSKATAQYRLGCATRDRGVMIEIGGAFAAALKGYNGISVETEGDDRFGEFIYLDAHWPEDEEECLNAGT